MSVPATSEILEIKLEPWQQRGLQSPSIVSGLIIKKYINDQIPSNAEGRYHRINATLWPSSSLSHQPWSLRGQSLSRIHPTFCQNEMIRNRFSSSYSTYTACSSSSLEMCSDMFLMLPMPSDMRSMVSSCLRSISCCCSSCTMYSLWGESAVLGSREYLLGPELVCWVGELG